MTLTISTVAPTLRLTTRTAVKNEIGGTFSAADDALIDVLLDQYSSAIVSYCHRPFAREAYTETLPGYGDIRLQLQRTPVVSVSAMTHYGNVVTGYSVDDADKGWLKITSLSGSGQAWERAAFPWSAQGYGGLSAGGAFMDLGTPLDRQEEDSLSVSYVAGYILPSQNVTATTISAANADSSFNDSASGFPSLLKAGDVIEVSGFSAAANNVRWLVTGTPTASKIVVSGTVTTEAAGASVTVKFKPPSSHRQFDDVEAACIAAVKSAFIGRGTDSSIVEKHAGPMGIRYSENKASEGMGLPPVCVGLLRQWVRAA